MNTASGAELLSPATVRARRVPGIRQLFIAAIGLVAALPATAAVVSYTAAPANLYANIAGTGVSDVDSGLSPFMVSANYPAPGEGSPSGNASANLTTLQQSLLGFHMQGSLSGSSVAGASSSLGVEAGAYSQYYAFTVSGPTAVYLKADYSRTVTGFDPGVGFFKANLCPATGTCPATGVSGLGTGILGGVSFTGTSFEADAVLAGGSYILDVYAFNKVFGEVPGGTGTFSDSFNIQLQFVPFEAVIPVPAAFWLFSGALAGLGCLKRHKGGSAAGKI